jgi:hypothetical protein
MGRFALVLGIALVPLVAATAHGSGARTPQLRIVAAEPLVVAGANFAARERVTVTALTSLRSPIVRTRATARGTFRVGFGSFTQPCGKPFAVRARGVSSGVALARLPGTPCIPPPR